MSPLPTLPPLPAPSALLFDLDGTLVDSKRDIADALNAALAAIGRAPLPLDAVVSMIGDGARNLVVRALGGDADSALVDRAVSLYQQAYAEHPCVHTTLVPGAHEAIAIDVPRAVLTNKPSDLSRVVLRELGILEAFDALYGGGDGPLKPAPDGVLALAARLGARVDHVWLIGDGPQDVLAGRAAGCVTIAVPGIAERSRVLEASPHIVVESLFDVVRLAHDALA